MSNLRWNPSVHATRRIKERCQVDPDQAKNFVNQLMQTASYVTTQGKCAIYHHIGRDLFIVVDADKDTIVTLYPSEDYEAKQGARAISEDSPLFSKIAAVAKRELAKAGASFRKTQRELTAQMSAMKIELARAEVNLLNAKAPHVKTIIREKIENYTRNIDVLTAELGRKQGEFERVKKDAQALIGGGDR